MAKATAKAMAKATATARVKMGQSRKRGRDVVSLDTPSLLTTRTAHYCNKDERREKKEERSVEYRLDRMTQTQEHIHLLSDRRIVEAISHGTKKPIQNSRNQWQEDVKYSSEPIDIMTCLSVCLSVYLCERWAF